MTTPVAAHSSPLARPAAVGRRVAVLYNPASGRGKGQSVVDACSIALKQIGCEPLVLAVGSGERRATPAEIEDAAASAHLLVLVGGDGTVHHALPLAMRTRVPIYQLPFGTENLFSREFGMSTSTERLTAAIRRWNVKAVDTATCDQRAFVLMASIGFDANIVQRVAEARRGTIHRLHYVVHGLNELLSPSFAEVTLIADGKELFSGRRGMVVIANSRQYAARLDPAHLADMTDGLLDVVYLPLASRLDFGVLGARALLKAHRSGPGVVVAKASHVRVLSKSAAAIQLDGEHAGFIPNGAINSAGDAVHAIDVRVRPASLNVLCPG